MCIRDSVYIDMIAHSPAMHEKKKLEAAMKQAFATEFGDNIAVSYTHLDVYKRQF